MSGFSGSAVPALKNDLRRAEIANLSVNRAVDQRYLASDARRHQQISVYLRPVQYSPLCGADQKAAPSRTCPFHRILHQRIDHVSKDVDDFRPGDRLCRPGSGPLAESVI